MKRIAIWALAGCISTAAVADELVTAAGLTAAQIVEKNIAARGGLEAWRKLQTMIWVGHIEGANAAVPSMPFVLELKRPNKTRFEIKAQNRLAVRIYDGTHRWKLRPTSIGLPELKPYTPEELSFAHDGQGIDGPLMDYQAKRVAITLDGVDDVAGRKTYRMSVKLPSGVSHHMWIDAQNFLDIKSDRESRNAFGQSGTVSVFYRNYRTIEGLQSPFTIESGADTSKTTDKMVIDKILLNPPLEDRIFAKPSVPGRHNVISVDATRPQPLRQPVRPAASLPPGLSRSNPRSMPGSADAQ